MVLKNGLSRMRGDPHVRFLGSGGAAMRRRHPTFGHRVIVGLNGEDGTVYARISFFSTLNFAVLLGTVTPEASRAVITDIDPLAKSPPDDIVAWTEHAAVGAVSKPDVVGAKVLRRLSKQAARKH